MHVGRFLFPFHCEIEAELLLEGFRRGNWPSEAHLANEVSDTRNQKKYPSGNRFAMIYPRSSRSAVHRPTLAHAGGGYSPAKRPP